MGLKHQNGLTRVRVKVRNLALANETYTADFLVDSGAADSLAPGSELARIGVQRVGKSVYELADGSKHEYPFGVAQISFLGETTAGRVIFGPDDAEPLLGITALESVGIVVDPTNRILKRSPAIPVK